MAHPNQGAILFHDVQVGQAKTSEFGHDRAERLARVGVKHAVENRLAAKIERRLVRSPDISDSLRYLKEQPIRLRHGSAIRSVRWLEPSRRN